MDGTCDADNDCYGWCHNTVSLALEWSLRGRADVCVARDVLYSEGEVGGEVCLCGGEVLMRVAGVWGECGTAVVSRGALQLCLGMGVW